MNNLKIKKICCVGAGYVGGPSMAVIADRCPDLNIFVVDSNLQRVDAWNNDDLSKLPIYEPGLDQVVSRTRNRNLFFSNNIDESIKKADMVFISVNTPIKEKGIGAGETSDLRWVESCARQISEVSEGHTIVVEKSTLPVRTAEVIKLILDEVVNMKDGSSNKKTFDVLSNPEFLAEGTAIKDLLYPDRVLIGGDNQNAINELSDIYLNWVPNEKILQTNIWSSELAKLTANAFLAQRISSINSIAAICEATGADVREVSRAIGTDTRIGSKFLDSGPGFGGSCFKKDILNLVYLAEYFGLPEVATFWNEVVKLNTWHQHRISKLIIKKLFGNLSSKKIAVLGFSFKSNTNDTRESASIQICKDLLDEGASLFIQDPKVDPKQIERDLDLPMQSSDLENNNLISSDGSWSFSSEIEDTFINADAILILTEWQEYEKINWLKMSQKVRKPCWVFDARSIIDPEKVINSGLNFWRVGDGVIKDLYKEDN